jgi:Domain of unknown function (DUF4410)
MALSDLFSAEGTMDSTHKLASFAAFALLATSGCANTTITPAQAVKPTQAYDTVTLGEVSVSDALWAPYVLYFRKGFDEQLPKEGLTKATEPAPDAPPATAISVSGRLTEVGKGDRALRLIIGFGAGRETAQGNFEIRDGQGSVLARFESREAYSGGAGIGGNDFLDAEDLVQRLGGDTAKAVARWTRGQALDGPDMQGSKAESVKTRLESTEN